MSNRDYLVMKIDDWGGLKAYTNSLDELNLRGLGIKDSPDFEIAVIYARVVYRSDTPIENDLYKYASITRQWLDYCETINPQECSGFVGYLSDVLRWMLSISDGVKSLAS